LLPGGSRKARPRLQFRWAGAISRDEWGVYRQAIEAVREAGVRFLLGGGFALAGFTGRWRDTKDIDFYIAPQDRDRAVAALPPRYREVIALFHIQHKSYAEIAETLRVPMGTVMTWLHRARKELKAQLSEHLS